MSVAVISWSRDVDLSQMDVRCLRLLLHSAAWCRLPVQLLKHSCFKSYCFLRLPTVTILLHLTHPRSVALQLTHLLCVGVTSFVWKVFSRLRNRLEFGGFSGFASLSSTEIDFFSSFHQLRKNSQSCHSSGPLTRSAFVPFSLSSTPLTFPDTSISQVSSAIAHCRRASPKIREFSPVRSL